MKILHISWDPEARGKSNVEPDLSIFNAPIDEKMVEFWESQCGNLKNPYFTDRYEIGVTKTEKVDLENISDPATLKRALDNTRFEGDITYIVLDTATWIDVEDEK